MKKLVCSLLLAVLLLSSLGMAAFATTYQNTFYRDLFYYSYEMGLPSDNVGPVFAYYFPLTAGIPACAATQLSVSVDQTGRTSTQINGDNGEIVVDSETGVEGGYITCTLYTRASTYALKVNHYANRRLVTGTSSDVWNYWVYDN